MTGSSSNNYSSNKTPHFFKVILNDDQLQGNLRIPRKFAQKHGSSLPGLLHLQLPSGLVEEVELRREDGELFLKNGWADFARLCLISFGCFVVFRYEGDSRFHVVVFDATACELEYPAKPGTGASSPGSRDTRPSSLPQVGRTDQGEEVLVIELSDDEDPDPCSRSDRKKSPSCFPRSSKRSRTKSPETDALMTGADPTELELGSQNSVDEQHGGSKRVLSAANLRALRRASSYKCERPSTIVTVQSKRGLYIPLNFWTTYFPGGGIGDIKVCVSGGKTWTISATNSKYPKFRRGWSKFLADNNLTEGDLCLFEVMASSEADFRVVIFRIRDGAQRPGDLKDSGCDNEARRGNSFSRALTGETSATNPLKNLRSSDILSQRNLQFQFPLVSSQEVGKTGEEKVEVEELNEDEDSDVFVDRNRKNPLSYGRYCKLDVGVQTEESIDNENLGIANMSSDQERPMPPCAQSSMRLTNISQGTDAPMATSTHSSQLQEPMERLHLKHLAEFGIRFAGDENPGTLHRAPCFLSEKPCCMVVCVKSHLYFPNSFLMRCFPGGRGTIKDIEVHVCGRGSWTVVANEERYPRFRVGWKEFAEGNELREGDVCLFKLERSGDIEFQAVAFRGEEGMARDMTAAVGRAKKKRHGKSEDRMKESRGDGDRRWMEFGNGKGENNLYF